MNKRLYVVHTDLLSCVIRAVAAAAYCYNFSVRSLYADNVAGFKLTFNRCNADEQQARGLVAFERCFGLGVYGDHALGEGSRCGLSTS